MCLSPSLVSSCNCAIHLKMDVEDEVFLTVEDNSIQEGEHDKGNSGNKCYILSVSLK